MITRFGYNKLIKLERLGLERDENILNISSKKLTKIDSKKKIKDAVKTLVGKHRRMIVTENKKFKGLITSIDMLNALGAGINALKHMGFNSSLKGIIRTKIYFTNPAATIEDVLYRLKREKVSCLPIIENNLPVAFVSEWDFVKNTPENYKELYVINLMTHKPMFAHERYSVFDIAKMMVRGGFRRLPILDDKNNLVGISTPTDILKYALNKKELNLKKLTAPATEIMNKNVFTVETGMPLGRVVKNMEETHIGGFPVVESKKLIGIITEKDIFKNITV